MKYEYLIPTRGVIVKDPRTGRQVPPQGAIVPVDTYFRRRIAEGAARIGKPPVEKTEQPAADTRKSTRTKPDTE